jgi:hypothetical protein
VAADLRFTLLGLSVHILVHRNYLLTKGQLFYLGRTKLQFGFIALLKQSVMFYYALSTDMYRRFGVAFFLHLQGLISVKDLFSVFKFVPLIQKSVVDSVLPSVSLPLPYRTPVHRRLHSNKGFAAHLYLYVHSFMENR